MRIEIDQSGKIEQTERHTVLCLSNDKNYSIFISRKVKRKIQRFFRENNQIRNFIIFTHSAGLSILLRRVKPLTKVIIDQEYKDKNAVIKNLIHEMCTNNKYKPIIQFKSIGKESRADYFAGLIAQGKLKPTWIIGFEELLREIKRTEVGKRLKNA